MIVMKIKGFVLLNYKIFMTKRVIVMSKIDVFLECSMTVYMSLEDIYF